MSAACCAVGWAAESRFAMPSGCVACCMKPSRALNVLSGEVAAPVVVVVSEVVPFVVPDVAADLISIMPMVCCAPALAEAVFSIMAKIVSHSLWSAVPQHSRAMASLMAPQLMNDVQ